MHNVWILLQAQFRNYFTVHKTTKAKNVKTSASKRKVEYYVAGAIVLGYVILNNIAVAVGLQLAGTGFVIYPYTATSAAVAIILLATFQIHGTLFANKQQNMLTGLPLAQWEIVASRFAFLYVLYLALTLVLIVPGALVWLIMSHAPLYIWCMCMITIPLVPLLPMIIAAMLSVIVYYVSSFFPYKGIISAVLLSVFLLALTILPLFFTGVSFELSDLPQLITNIIKMYPPAMLLQQLTKDGNSISAILFIASSLAAFYLFILFVGKNYLRIVPLFIRKHKHTTHVAVDQKPRSVLKTLIQQELRVFFDSSVLLLNIGFGIILLVIISIGLLFVPVVELVQDAAGINILLYARYLPYILSSFVILVYFSASSISLEGNKLWIKQTMPITLRTFLLSKVLANLVIIIFPLLFAMLVLLIKVQPSFMEALLLILVPISYSIGVSVLGIVANNAFPKFNWSSETEVVKQGMPIIITMLGMMLFLGLPIMLSFTLPDLAFNMIAAAIACIQIVIAILVFNKITQKEIIQYE